MEELLNELKNKEKENDMEIPIEGESSQQSGESGVIKKIVSNISVKNKNKDNFTKVSKESLHARDRAINKMAEKDASIDFECNDKTRIITIHYFNINQCILNFYVSVSKLHKFFFLCVCVCVFW